MPRHWDLLYLTCYITASRGLFIAILGCGAGQMLIRFSLPNNVTDERVPEMGKADLESSTDEINRLVQEAQALLSVLLNLEDRLDLIHDIAVRDDVKAQ